MAHPGHELQVHAWLCRTRPRVHVLTDGSGAGGVSRLRSSARILDAAGCARGVFGRFTDAELYALTLAGEVGRFLALADELARSLGADEVDAVAADALEGYNPAHDLCRALVDAARALATRASGRPIASYRIRLAPGPRVHPAPAGALTVALTAEELDRKARAALDYTELTPDVRAALEHGGPDSHRVEVLERAPDWAGEPPEVPPFYEKHGERRVALGKYARVLRYREHARPIVEALRRHAGVEGPGG